MPEITAATPVIPHRRTGRFAINMEQHRVLFPGIKVIRFDLISIQLHTRFDLHAEKFHRPAFQGCEF